MLTHTFNADEFIPKYAVVSINENKRLVNTQWPNISSVNNHLGIALNEANAGQSVEVCLIGIIDNPGWSFIPLRPVYASYTGTLTQEFVNRSVLKIGKALSSTTLYIYPSDLMVISND